MPSQALLFDLDDTLIADTSDTLAALAETCALVEPVAERCSELAAAVKARAWELWASPAYGGAIGHELGISGTEAMFARKVDSHKSHFVCFENTIIIDDRSCPSTQRTSCSISASRRPPACRSIVRSTRLSRH